MNFYLLDGNIDNGTPARVNRKTGDCYFSKKFFEQYTDEQRAFIINHEIGHYKLQTSDETEADYYAAKQLIPLLGLKKTFEAMNYSLHFTDFNDFRRTELFKKLNKINNMIIENDTDGLKYEEGLGEFIEISYEPFEDENGFVFTNDYVCYDDDAEITEEEAEDYVNWCNFYGYEYSDASKEERAAKKAAKQAKKDQKAANKQAKIDAKLARKEARTNLINARGESKIIKSNAKQTLAEQGIDSGIGAGLKNLASGAKDIIGGIFGGGNSGSDGGEYYAEMPEEKSKLPLILGIVGGVIALAVVVIVIMKKK